jgi:hypothetical protein
MKWLTWSKWNKEASTLTFLANCPPSAGELCDINSELRGHTSPNETKDLQSDVIKLPDVTRHVLPGHKN